MSFGAVIFQEAMRRTMRYDFPDVTRRDVVAGYEAGRKVLSAVYAAAIEAPLSREEQLLRAVAVFSAHAAGNIADDVADGDCDYFEPNVPVATTVQYLLHTIAFDAALESSVERAVLSRMCRALIDAAAWEPVELRRTGLDEKTYLDIANAMGGRQWQAYLAFLWAGTPLAPQAEPVGGAIALSSFIALDVAGKDKRLFSLSDDARARIVSLAKKSLEPAVATGLGFIGYIQNGVQLALGETK